MRKRHCPFCRQWFEPDPRQKDKQRTCGKAECQKQRRKENSQRWRKKNKDYYKNRYGDYLKVWLAKHPEYLKNYRRNHPDYVESNRQKQKERDTLRKRRNLDKQIALPQNIADNKGKIEQLGSLANLDIRIARTLKFLVFEGKTAKLASFLDIQTALGKQKTNCYS